MVSLHIRRERPIAPVFPIKRTETRTNSSSEKRSGKNAIPSATASKTKQNKKLSSASSVTDKHNATFERYDDFAVTYIVHNAVAAAIARAPADVAEALKAAVAAGGPSAAVVELAAETATLSRLGFPINASSQVNSNSNSNSKDDSKKKLLPVTRIVPSEEALYHDLRHFVLATDPDVLLGYELQRASWGYLRARFTAVLPHLMPFELAISRKLPFETTTVEENELNYSARAAAATGGKIAGWESYQAKQGADISCDGRIVLNIWRILRKEIKMSSSTLTASARDVLNITVPTHDPWELSRWILSALAPALTMTPAHSNSASSQSQSTTTTTAAAGAAAAGAAAAAHYLALQCRVTLDIISKLELMDRTAQMAKAYGMRFYDILHRGSQIRVEAMLLRVTRPLQFVCVGMSPQQVAAQPGLESQALTLEPEPFSYYSSPVAVLDFRSLYPSVVIANNLCYSTCLGRLSGNDLAMLTQSAAAMKSAASSAAPCASPSDLNTQSLPSTPPPSFRVPLGGFELDRNWTEIVSLHKRGALWVAPNGVIFVRPTVREGVLPRMLAEVLETRFEVKAAMKAPHVARGANATPQQQERYRLYNALQLALKLVANVTYGYTSAGYSGRMPCQELADSIVQTARDTVERAMAMVNGHPKWRARVVYGDTDSLFVLLEGRSRAEAHVIAKEISETVTASCPFPIHLEYEKVYHPCVIAAKKRYVGNKFESAIETKGVIDCKGMEIIRRDSCPLLQKTMTESVSILFNTNDLSRVRNYLNATFYNVRLNLTPLSDFVFNREVSLGTYKPGGTPPPAAMVAYREARRDANAIPLYGERVPYIVVQSPQDAMVTGGARLVDKLMTPRRYLALLAAGTAPPLCAQYYLGKVLVPALKRVFDLIGPSHGSNLPVTAHLRLMPPLHPESIANVLSNSNLTAQSSTVDLASVGVIAQSFPGAFGRFPCHSGDITTRATAFYSDPLYQSFGSLEGFLPAADVEAWLAAVLAVKLPPPLAQAARRDGSLGMAPESSRPPPPMLTGADAAAAAGATRVQGRQPRHTAANGDDEGIKNANDDDDDDDDDAEESNADAAYPVTNTPQNRLVSLHSFVKPRFCFTCGTAFAPNAPTFAFGGGDYTAAAYSSGTRSANHARSGPQPLGRTTPTHSAPAHLCALCASGGTFAVISEVTDALADSQRRLGALLRACNSCSNNCHVSSNGSSVLAQSCVGRAARGGNAFLYSSVSNFASAYAAEDSAEVPVGLNEKKFTVEKSGKASVVEKIPFWMRGRTTAEVLFPDGAGASAGVGAACVSVDCAVWYKRAVLALLEKTASEKLDLLTEAATVRLKQSPYGYHKHQSATQ